jgi:transcriptional regulator with XRE-family HTH domain
VPGYRLRQVRERLGLTYRDVERASYELASRKERPEFIVHISRLADIENRAVIPSLHKVYSLSAIYHLDPLEILRWYDVPLEECFHDGGKVAVPETHIMAPPRGSKIPMKFDPGFDPQKTELFSRMVEQWSSFDAVLVKSDKRHIYGYIGMSDRRMVPLLRPGSTILIDTTVRKIEQTDWSTEHDRPMYFVEIRDGYRCGWFDQQGTKLVMQPHPLSRCLPEAWQTPDDAEVVGRVMGIVTRFHEPGYLPSGEPPKEPADWNRRVP